jgi:hypothetical protein
MSEKLYEFLLKLYPDHFRRTYGDEALRLVRDRACSETGFLSRLRLWLDLLLDLARSLPREYSNPPTIPIGATQLVNGASWFQLLAERSPNPTLLGLGGTLSAALFWVCVFAAAHGGGFPALFPAPLALQGLSLGAPAQADGPSVHSVSGGTYSFCATAKRDIPSNSVQPLFAFHFASPGASGVALIDGKVVKTFKNEQRLSIRALVFAGDHQFVLHLDRSAENTFRSSNDDFSFCQAK